MKTVSLTGWGQALDALDDVLPQDAVAFDYAAYHDLQACFSGLAELAPERVVGWSLGGQIAVRAIAAGAIKPKHLILIAAPYQVRATQTFPFATPEDMLEQSRSAFLMEPLNMMGQFQTLVAMGHAHQRRVLQHLLSHQYTHNYSNLLFWFDELIRFSCDTIDFKRFPITELVYGESDMVVPPQQGELYHARIANSNLHRLAGCGHAPHWHDKTLLHCVIQRNMG